MLYDEIFGVIGLVVCCCDVEELCMLVELFEG